MSVLLSSLGKIVILLLLTRVSKSSSSNVDSSNSRLVSTRLDQLDLRIRMRFDNIENTLTTTKLRLDLLSDELTRIEEGLGRKWKLLESKFDQLLNNIDVKLESKLVAMQRDNRRHNEFLSTAFNNALAVTTANSAGGLTKLDKVPISSSKKVENMFEDLLKQSGNILESVKVSKSNAMSSVIVESLSSVESISTALGRRITDLSQSVDERLEMVSQSINGFLENCQRIQLSAPLIEENIAEMLIRIIDSVENSTRLGTEQWERMADETIINIMQSKHQCACGEEELTEEERKSLWDSWFPNSTTSTTSSDDYNY